MKKICVLGAGTMGAGIAQAFAAKGYEVVLRDIKDEFVERGIAGIKKGLSKLVTKGKMSQEDADAIEGRITGTTDLNLAADCDLVVEAAVENMEIKKQIFSDLDKICKAETILASNTSSLSITEVAAATNRPDKVIGMHFFNPAPVMKLIEIIKGMATSDETFNAIKELSVAIGKEPVEVSEAPGFVVNKILVPMINEAVGIFAEGIASAEDIDKAMMLGANHPMGPLALGDLIGLDVCLAIMDVLYKETGDTKYRAHALLRKYVRAGYLGRKTGKGLFDYIK
ncbi:3-hydroxybutyryl-CoA dehydrogenase [Clostridium sp. PL3]|uniref:3-hydroxybutyryl-CoA dehydrogenase n=1 Tax=Clostridium thailandense TaxID=2794346 RepID=A0A949X3J3_9CLOT|nr:3-hydroxybutyryl-CoA dehydrogenase [Clostridium thailandense]MBV7274714.1 3-hydroxybutyryl-CoA dehydrogenase [Clostridium thailandense]